MRFKDTADALTATVALVEGRLGKRLKKLLKGLVDKGVHEELLVADSRLSSLIKEKYAGASGSGVGALGALGCVAGAHVHEMMRCVRGHLLTTVQVPGLSEADLHSMQLGLAHSLARYKLKFSPDKVDTMIVQAVCMSVRMAYVSLRIWRVGWDLGWVSLVSKLFFRFGL